jgi:hypothetical protein
MEIQEAIKVIRALADGVNRETRDLLKDDSICRNSQAVMALNRALAALVTLQERRVRGSTGHERKITDLRRIAQGNELRRDRENS